MKAQSVNFPKAKFTRTQILYVELSEKIEKKKKFFKKAKMFSKKAKMFFRKAKMFFRKQKCFLGK